MYERDNKSNIEGFNAEFRRMPIQMSMSLNYVLSNFNESIVLLEELISKLSFQRYFKIVYLGQLIECSIEFPTSQAININKIDMASTETNQELRLAASAQGHQLAYRQRRSSEHLQRAEALGYSFYVDHSWC